MLSTKNRWKMVMAQKIGSSKIFSNKKACKLEAVHDLLDINIPENTRCIPCQVSKKTRVHFSEREGPSSKPLKLIHTDLCQPTRKNSLRGEEYFILFIDEFSRMFWIGIIKHKDEAFENFKAFKALVQNGLDRKTKCLRFDRGE